MQSNVYTSVALWMREDFLTFNGWLQLFIAGPMLSTSTRKVNWACTSHTTTLMCAHCWSTWHFLLNVCRKRLQTASQIKVRSYLMDGVTRQHTMSCLSFYIPKHIVGYACKCVAFPPLENEGNQAADEQLQLIKNVLDLHDRPTSDRVAVIADSCAMDKAVVPQIGPMVIGSASLRFNLTVKDLISENGLLIGDRSFQESCAFSQRV